MHKTLFLLLISSFTFSQTHTITGVVSDSINVPLESANIIAKPLMENAQLKFAIADNKGRYCLELENAIKYEVTAWFCPQIPLNFGPVYYNDLPGLILEISYLDVTLVATKITLELEDKKIIKPYGMNKISIDEYSIKLSDKITEMIEEADIHEGKK